MNVTNDELQGVYSDGVNTELVANENLMIKHLMGPAIAHQKYISTRWNLFSKMINHLNRSGYSVCFDIAINGIMGNKMEIYDLLDIEGGTTPVLDQQMASREITFERLNRFLFRLDHSKLSKESLLGALIILFSNVSALIEIPVNTQVNKSHEKLRNSIRSRQYNSFVRASYERVTSLRQDLFYTLKNEGLLSELAFKFFEFDEIEMRKMGKNATREIKRFVLSKDLNL
jgi:hypothetical protein